MCCIFIDNLFVCVLVEIKLICEENLLILVIFLIKFCDVIIVIFEVIFDLDLLLIIIVFIY